MQITEKIRNAIQKNLEHLGSIDKLAQVSGVSRAAMYNICNGSTHIISEKNYNKLIAVIEPFLEEGYNVKNIKSFNNSDLTELDNLIISKLVLLPEVQKTNILKQILEELASYEHSDKRKEKPKQE